MRGDVTPHDRLTILADDFTGACDAAGAFASSRDTIVVVGDRADSATADVVALDLDLRERSEPEAAEHTLNAARWHRSERHDARVYVKIDSTLRGPIAGLIGGALEGSGKEVAVIAPAFPEQGRLLEGGRLVLEGRVGKSLPEALGMSGIALLGSKFARTAEEVVRAVEHATVRGARYVVVDADGPDCLASVAGAFANHPKWLVVGSAGLARHVAGASGAARMSAGRGPILVVAGSPAPATRAQLERLAALEEEVVVLCTEPTTERDSGEAARALAARTTTWAVRNRPGAVVLAGGATAREVCTALGVTVVRLRGEFAPGVPFGTIVGGTWDGVAVVTKAGGFGTPETLVDVVRALGVSSVHD